MKNKNTPNFSLMLYDHCMGNTVEVYSDQHKSLLYIFDEADFIFIEYITSSFFTNQDWSEGYLIKLNKDGAPIFLPKINAKWYCGDCGETVLSTEYWNKPKECIHCKNNEE